MVAELKVAKLYSWVGKGNADLRPARCQKNRLSVGRMVGMADVAAAQRELRAICTTTLDNKGAKGGRTDGPATGAVVDEQPDGLVLRQSQPASVYPEGGRVEVVWARRTSARTQKPLLPRRAAAPSSPPSMNTPSSHVHIAPPAHMLPLHACAYKPSNAVSPAPHAFVHALTLLLLRSMVVAGHAVRCRTPACRQVWSCSTQAYSATSDAFSPICMWPSHYPFCARCCEATA